MPMCLSKSQYIGFTDTPLLLIERLPSLATLTIIGDSPFFKTLNLLQITEIVASINLG